MKGVELYGQVRRAVYVEGLSRREAARRFGIDPRTVAILGAAGIPAGSAAGAAILDTRRSTLAKRWQ